MHNVLDKIDNLQTKMALLKLKSIITKEYSNGYYDNAANIKEIIDLLSYEVYDEYGALDYKHIENLAIYNNGMPQFNSFDSVFHYVTPPACWWSFKDDTKVDKKKTKRKSDVNPI